MKKSTLVYVTLAIILFAGYLMQIGSYPLLDVDETRYVEIARNMIKNHDFLTLYINGDFFFEKPPLFFWIECLFFKLSGCINELTARLPVILLSLLPLGLLFNLCKKVKNIRFAFITTAVLLTTLEYLLLTKIAILDSVLTTFVTSSVLCYFYTFFTTEKNKKYFWYAAYVFMGLAVLAKGIPGFVIPAGTILIATFIFKTYKETFKYLRLGILIFLLITLPWHVIMLKTYPDLFFSEYIYKHHILRFLGSDVIHRSQPWYFYLLTLLWGLMPHMFVIIPKLFGRIKFTKPEIVSDFSKFQTLNIIVILLTLIFFSVSKTKLITYILPVYPFCAVIIAKIWNDFIRKDDVRIRYSLVILNSLLITAAFIIPFAASYFLNPDGNLYLMQLVLAILAYFSTVSLIKKKRFNIFLTQMLLVSALFGFTTPLGYKLDYTFGQNDLIKFAEYAKENNYTISTYKTGKRYSLLYYSGLEEINFYKEDNPEWLKQELCRKNNIVIIRNKDIKDLPVKIKEQGKKYSIIEKL